MIKFSVVIPLFNKEDYIERCIRSVAAQVYDNYEIIVVDDGSTDMSVELVNRLKISNLRLIQQENGGVSKARNTGISNAVGEWVAFLDADDFWEPEYLHEMTILQSKYSSASLCCSAYCFDSPNGRKPAKLCIPGKTDYRLIDNYFYTTCRGNLPVTASSVSIKRAALNEIGGFPEGWKMGEDIFVWMRIAIDYQLAICMKQLAIYDESDTGSATKKNKVLNILPHVKALEEWLDSSRVPERQIHEAKNLVHRSYIYTALQNLKEGNQMLARDLVANTNVRFGIHAIAIQLLSVMPNWLVKRLL